MVKKRWTLQPVEEAKAMELSEALKIRKIYGTLLVQRNITTFEQARIFFRPAWTDLHDPFLMKDMDLATQRLTHALENGEKVLVYGDYDVDGTTAVALVYTFLKEYFDHLGFYLPHRHREGYGLSPEGIEFARENGFTLMVVLDCGIKALKQVAYARTLGIEVIVCDHHLPDAALPAAAAILNPKQADCPYPYKELSGCGIGFKLISALAKRWGSGEERVTSCLELVALSIAADIVPVTGENRVLAHFGLKKLNERPIPGIRALQQVCQRFREQVRPLGMEDLVYQIAPRINAAGRMGEADQAVKLFIEKDFTMALRYAGALQEDNDDRKDLDKSMTLEALEMLRENELTEQRSSTVLYQPHWHKGIIGIVASRVMETYYRPTILLTASNGQLSGSARSVRGFNIYEVLKACDEYLENYGGHHYAAGMTIKPENLQAFRERFEAVVSSTIDPELLIPEIRIDAIINLSNIQPGFYETLRQFEPFGPGNRKPVFLATGVRDLGFSRVLQGNHIRFEVKQGDSALYTGIGFNLASKFEILGEGAPFDLCFDLDENTWNGRTNLQLKVLDIRPS